MLLDISIIPQTSEELFYFVTKRIPYLCGFWRFANAYLSIGMKGEIAHAALFQMPMIVFDEGLYHEVQKEITKHGGDKRCVQLDRENFIMGFSSPVSYLENAVMFK